MELASVSGSHITPDFLSILAALERLKTELERRENQLREDWEAFRKRQAFLEMSGARLLDKIQTQQDRELRFGQKEEDLRAIECRLLEREAVINPALAAKLAARKFDPFNE
jgi:hypothetical protein